MINAKKLALKELIDSIVIGAANLNRKERRRLLAKNKENIWIAIQNAILTETEILCNTLTSAENVDKTGTKLENVQTETESQSVPNVVE